MMKNPFHMLEYVWPYNIAARAWPEDGTIYRLSPRAIESILIDDAAFTKAERNVIWMVYHDGQQMNDLGIPMDAALDLEKAAVAKLRSPHVDIAMRKAAGIVQKKDVLASRARLMVDYGLSYRTVHALEAVGVSSLDDLSRMRRKDASRIRGIGEKGLAEIEARMAEHGLSFKEG